MTADLSALIAKLEGAPNLTEQLWMEMLAALIGGDAEATVSPFNGRWVIYQGVTRSGARKCWEPSYGTPKWLVAAHRHVIQLVGNGLSLDSIDVALTLVGPDAFWRVGHDGEGQNPGNFKAEVLKPLARVAAAVSGTPALALCIAALKSRALSADREASRG